MTFPSSSAPLVGISRARLPAWALPDGWPTRANGEPLLADLAFRDGRIAALTPTDQPTPGLWDLAGALTLPGLVEPHAHLDKTFTIERCRPAQAGAAGGDPRYARGSPALDQGGYSTSGVRRAGPGGSEWRDPFAQPCRLVYRRRAGRLAGDRPPRYRRHHPGAGWRWSRCPCFASRRKRRPSPGRSPTSESAACWAASSTPPTGTPPPWKICCTARPAGIWIWICILMRSSAKCLRG